METPTTYTCHEKRKPGRPRGIARVKIPNTSISSATMDALNAEISKHGGSFGAAIDTLIIGASIRITGEGFEFFTADAKLARLFADTAATPEKKIQVYRKIDGSWVLEYQA